MGAKPSKTPKSEPNLKRTKSFSSYGRSSQRILFQNSKIKLNQINKKLQKYEEKYEPEIQKQLEDIEKEFNEISQVVKEKNKKKYEEVWEFFLKTRQEFENKTKPKPKEEEDSKVEEESSKPTPQHVELKLVKVVVPEEDQSVELRQQTPVIESLEQEVPRSPKVKFGIQVMPINPRVSQELLKRNTLPINEAPKAEFMDLRKRAQSDDTQQYKNIENELYKETSFITTNISSSPIKQLEKRQVNAKALQAIELITHDIDILEDRLKYFHGNKEDLEYLELHERFIKNLLKLDSLDTEGDPVVRQERKISIQRIQELMKILECLVKRPEEPVNDDDDDEVDKSVYDFPEKRQEEVVNAEGKPITATAL